MDGAVVSDRLFGRRCRLPIAAWIAQHPKGRFYQGEVPLYGTVSRSNVNEELHRLLDLGMLDEERPDDARRVYYVRRTSPLWEVVVLAASIIGLSWEDDRVDLGGLTDS